MTSFSNLNPQLVVRIENFKGELSEAIAIASELDEMQRSDLAELAIGKFWDIQPDIIPSLFGRFWELRRWKLLWSLARVAREKNDLNLVDRACEAVLSINPEFWFAREFKKHARGYYSQCGQEQIIEQFFNDFPPRSKVFVEVGAFDGCHYSNVRRLYERQGWTGICIEPVGKNFKKLSQSYQNTPIQCIQVAVGSAPGTADLNVATYPHLPDWGSDVSSLDEGEMGRWQQYGAVWEKETVAVLTLTQILRDRQVRAIDLLSVDTEGYDLEVLKGLDFQIFKPRLIVIEYGSNREAILEFIKPLGYSVISDNGQDLFLANIDGRSRPPFDRPSATRNYTGLTGKPPYEEIQTTTEKKLHEFLKRSPEELQRVVIVGGYLGFEVDRLLATYPQLEIHIFEASPRYFNRLENRFSNHPRVFCHHYAVSDRTGTLTLHETTLDGCGSLFPIKKNRDARTWIAPQASPAEEYAVPAIRLDDFQPLIGKNIDLLWCDVQGAEINVLKGGEKTLERCQSLFLEVWMYQTMYEGQCNFSELQPYLNDRQFYLQGIGLDPGGNGTGNSFWVKVDDIENTPVKEPEISGKIVGLVAARNEEKIIEQCLRSLSYYADAIVFLDDASDDDTLQIVRAIAGECKVEKILTKTNWYRDEPGDRNALLQAGRQIGGTHFIVLDADEMLTANCHKTGGLREIILNLKPGDKLKLNWIQLWRSTDRYRYDNSVWTWNYKDFIFGDDGRCAYNSDFIHTSRTPYNLSGETYQVDEDYTYGVLHFQFVNWRNLLVKQAWYRCLERIRNPRKPVAQINALYRPSKDETNLGLKDAPQDWFLGYPFFDATAYRQPEQWREKQVLQWFEEYGQAFFAELDIGDVDWGKGLEVRSQQFTPKVSAIVSTYNSEKFLRGCLEDLTNQTLYKNGELEIIVIDSKSEQNEKQIVSEFQGKYPQIIYHQTESRETLYAAWNRAIALAKGDYITNANTDDRRRQDASEVMAEYLDKNPDVAVVYGDQLITQNENETFDNTQANRRWNWPEFSYEELERRCILGPQPMWRKSLHEKYGNFREELQVAGDYEFWLRVGKTEKIVKLQQVFGLYYEHPRGLEKSSPTMVREVRQIWQEYGISQRGIQPKTSVPVPVSPTELDSMREGTPTTPQISIIIPCYNQANYLKEAVDSILSQTIADWECIIVNDGSSDGTPVVAELLIELHRDRTLKLINQENKGVVAARNVGLSQARGNYLLFLDADDKLHPNFLAETLEILQQKPDVGFVYTDIEYFGNQQGVKTDGDFDPSRLLRSNQASITSLFRRSICDRIGGFKTEMEAGLEDWEFWVAAYESGWPGYRLPKPYLYYRQYADGSRLQKLLGDRETLAVQKAKIIALHPNLYTLEEVGPAAQILQDRGIVIHPVQSAANIVSNPEQFLADVTDLVSRYNRGSGDRTGLDKLRQLRRELAEFWSNCEPETLQSHYTGAPGKAQKLLLKSGIKHEVKTESEINDGRTLQTAIADNYSHGTAIATMLYFWPHQLSIPYEKLALPQWLAADYLDFLLSNPEFFQEVGEADRYRQYFLGLLRYLHRSIFDNQDSQNWKNIAWFVTTHCRVISLYFNTENLKEIYTLRGDIIEFALRSRGAQIDWDIPRRSPERQKIRVGILSKHFGPMTETFATLPAFEYLHREQFEVVLYALQTDGNSVEQYCRDRADRFVHLSGSLMAQVEAIRGDELDVLLVGTNVTAVTHEITLIACHRLARVQLTCFNSPVTTGFKNIDFYIAGELMELPKNGGDHYREKLVKIPGAGCCFSYTVEPQKTAPPPQRQQLGIPDDAIAFMSGANLYKLTPELRETWAKILVAVPHSNLVVLPFGASWTSQYPEVAFREQMQALFNRHNIDPKRLKILGALPNRAQVKAVLQLGDIYLDSFPYAGTTSLVDPLEVGLPVVVWEGNTLRSRMGAAMVRSLLPNEAIPASEQAYIDAAVQLAADVGGRQRKSQEIRKQMAANPEFLDSRNYAVKMGAVFAQLFQLRRRQEEAIALENPAVRQQFLAELVDRVNLYDLDPTNADVVEKLRHTRRVMAEYWLNQPPEKLETLYQQPVGKGYQILLNRGIQKEPLTDSEQVLVNQLAKVATGLAQPNSINCLMVVMLYSQPGKMFVRDASRRLPGWLYSDYQRIFENSEAIAQIQRAAAGQPPTPQKVEELAPEAIQFDNPQSINRAIGCAKLFQIDPTDADIAAELRQLRWQMAHFWLNLPEEILKETYDRDIGDAFRSLLHSRLQNERLTQQEWDFLQTLATYLRQGLDAPRSIHYLMAAMLYYRPEQVQIQNPSRLPDRLRRDYESWQNSTSE